ncbi:hypothetical protein A2V56_00265 [Candidatus Woesebacteria bacterium RBG_19FT_COMBO_42_9]|uniref:DUF5672 domain-containing protein n=1 Tax=Candidatus Woesebacteria bacterium RBG_16_42_24 TaxID=1802485 RepID=A0A1F7XKL5_9BACT|nr:MAG: hypothetical protein A2V97_00865 [Candidatus Woesebacteria bacterium RBG_16_42_24]OGM16664.1 MAG: hypothetical protein A2V56_00265 [Candidatus Woesebacteria bacterium RBG_19FT_COMBO_42_9]
MKTVAIVTPSYYKPRFSEEDLISLEHLKKHLGKYDRYFLVPDGINSNKLKKGGFGFIKFPSEFFASTKTYNQLLLSEDFYKAFKNYKYLLIYQLDALVFSDQLLKWCNRGYDYISAPWFKTVIGSLAHKKGFPASGGNGGFCLRNVQSSLKVLERVNMLAKRSSAKSWVRKMWFFLAVITGKSHKKWLNAPATNYPFNEDGFWSLEAPKYLPGYRVAPFKTALKFGFERFPRKCYELNKKKLPFGCHSWEKYDKDFWLPYL